MLKFTIQDLHRDSPRCANTCDMYKEEGCGACTLRYRIVFKCSNCGVIKHFYGANNPANCSICKRTLPDMFAMSQSKHPYIRAKYHLEESE